MASRLPALRSRFDISVWTDSLTRPDGSVFHLWRNPAMVAIIGHEERIPATGSSLESPCYDSPVMIACLACVDAGDDWTDLKNLTSLSRTGSSIRLQNQTPQYLGPVKASGRLLKTPEQWGWAATSVSISR
ncbi:hypothetical protein [Klebsiella quasipneumoniae]|uniref:hypothetical protein n=1 Tax=Klebsiella quasipneumoniae TaxID=1463165 RepID=UPI00388DC893